MLREHSQAARAVWDAYYANHQTKGALRHLKVADPFMGGGTTIVEGSRLGMQMFGCDLNPVAWFVTKNEMTDVDLDEVHRLLKDLEDEVKPMIAPYFACDGPGGEKGRWFRRLTESKSQEGNGTVQWEELDPDFDIFTMPWQERRNYRYEGPEIIYTFWGKHAPCQRTGCGHRTPIMTSPVVATKTLSVPAWFDRECPDCGTLYDVERYSARMAPDCPMYIASGEKPFAVMSTMGEYRCPQCGRRSVDVNAAREGQSASIGKAKNKKVELTLLLHPQWLAGSPRLDPEGDEYGGSVTDVPNATQRWNNFRASQLRLLECRGTLPEQVTCPETKVTFYTDGRGGTVPKRSTFTCQLDGTQNDVLTAIKSSGKSGPMAAYVIQGSPRLDPLDGANVHARLFREVLLGQRGAGSGLADDCADAGRLRMVVVVVALRRGSRGVHCYEDA